MAHSEVAHKYLFKVFYKKTYKKEYKSQILEYNIYYINIIAIYNTIFIAKILVESAKKKELVVGTPDIEVTQVYSITNALLKFNGH